MDVSLEKNLLHQVSPVCLVLSGLTIFSCGLVSKLYPRFRSYIPVPLTEKCPPWG